MEDEPELEAAWQHYLAAAETARHALQDTPRFRHSPGNRAVAYHSLAEAQAMAYNFAIAPRMDNPRIFIHTAWFNYIFSLGQNGPDAYYGVLFLDGRCSYRMTGRWGDLRVMVMQVHSHLLGHPASRVLGDFDFSGFTRDEHDRFDVTLSAEPQARDWIPLDPQSHYNFLLFRRLLGDWHDDPGAADIRLVGGPRGTAAMTPGTVAERLHLAADFLGYLIKDWTIGLYEQYRGFAGGINVIGEIAGQAAAEDIATSGAADYGLGVFRIAPDEALILELDPPDSAYWSVALGDAWSKALDFMHYQTDTNMVRACCDPDGKLRMVIALEDPGLANWLDPVGCTEGLIVYRNYRPVRPAFPSARLVKLADLAAALPADTRRIAPEQRQAALEYRRQGMLKLFAQ